jgi:hypothetical protein
MHSSYPSKNFAAEAGPPAILPIWETWDQESLFIIDFEAIFLEPVYGAREPHERS